MINIVIVEHEKELTWDNEVSYSCLLTVNGMEYRMNLQGGQTEVGGVWNDTKALNYLASIDRRVLGWARKANENYFEKEHDWRLNRLKSLEELQAIGEATQAEVDIARQKFIVVARKAKKIRDGLNTI